MSGFSELNLVKASCLAGVFVENRWFFTALQSLVILSCLEIFLKIAGVFFFYSFVRSRGRLVFGYFLKTPFVRGYI